MTLYLLPNLLSENASPQLSLPPGVSAIIDELHGLIVENAKEGRAYLKRIAQRKPTTLPLLLLNEHTKEEEIEDLLKQILGKQKWGIVSDAGLPCIADPGARLVARARREGVVIRALPGPCSLLLALMLSGLPAQRFTFHGYLPREPQELISSLRRIQQRAACEQETQLFIEAPYRNERLFQYLLKYLAADTLLCIACDLTSPTEEVFTMTIKEWRAKSPPSLHNRPAVFLFWSK